IPSPSHTLIPRPRLTAQLNASLQHKLTLTSAPAGFGKTTLLSAWVQSLPSGNPHVAWFSLDEGDNDPLRFWEYALTALDNCTSSWRLVLILLYRSLVCDHAMRCSKCGLGSYGVHRRRRWLSSPGRWVLL